MKNKLVLVALTLSLIAVGVSVSRAPQQTTGRETAYDHIMRTRTIRCSYIVWPPFFTKDPNTGGFSGVYFDLMERTGHDLALKIDWAEEVGTADAYEGIRSGRTDLYCGAVTPMATRSTAMEFTRPLGYDPFHLYVRENDRRFDKDLSLVNNEAITMISLDGYVAATITKEEFPKAKLVTLPNMTTDADVLMSVASGKGDAAVCDVITAKDYMKHNPGQIRQVEGPPVRYPAVALAVAVGEDRLRTMLDTVLTEYHETGVMKKIMMKYGLDEQKVLLPARPFAESRRP